MKLSKIYSKLNKIENYANFYTQFFATQLLKNLI